MGCPLLVNTMHHLRAQIVRCFLNIPFFIQFTCCTTCIRSYRTTTVVAAAAVYAGLSVAQTKLKMHADLRVCNHSAAFLECPSEAHPEQQ